VENIFADAEYKSKIMLSYQFALTKNINFLILSNNLAFG